MEYCEVTTNDVNIMSKKQKISNDCTELEVEKENNVLKEKTENDFHGDMATNAVEKEEDEEESLWWTIPDLVLLQILNHLTVKDIASVSATCRRWFELSNDDTMWKHRFQEHFRTDPAITLKPGGLYKHILSCLLCIFCNKKKFAF